MKAVVTFEVKRDGSAKARYKRTDPVDKEFNNKGSNTTRTSFIGEEQSASAVLLCCSWFGRLAGLARRKKNED